MHLMREVGREGSVFLSARLSADDCRVSLVVDTGMPVFAPAKTRLRAMRDCRPNSILRSALLIIESKRVPSREDLPPLPTTQLRPTFGSAAFPLPNWRSNGSRRPTRSPRFNQFREIMRLFLKAFRAVSRFEPGLCAAGVEVSRRHHP